DRRGRGPADQLRPGRGGRQPEAAPPRPGTDRPVPPLHGGLRARAGPLPLRAGADREPGAELAGGRPHPLGRIRFSSLAADPLFHSARWRVRRYEVDSNGHVNNAVYLNWAEEIAELHAEAAGYGRAWSIAQSGTWVLHHAEITWRKPAVQDDEVEVSVRLESIRGVRG